MKRTRNEIYSIEELPNRIIKVISTDDAEYLERYDEIMVIFNNMHVPLGDLEYVEENELYIKLHPMADIYLKDIENVLYCKFYVK